MVRNQPLQRSTSGLITMIQPGSLTPNDTVTGAMCATPTERKNFTTLPRTPTNGTTSPASQSRPGGCSATERTFSGSSPQDPSPKSRRPRDGRSSISRRTRPPTRTRMGSSPGLNSTLTAVRRTRQEARRRRNEKICTDKRPFFWCCLWRVVKRASDTIGGLVARLRGRNTGSFGE